MPRFVRDFFWSCLGCQGGPQEFLGSRSIWPYGSIWYRVVCDCLYNVHGCYFWKLTGKGRRTTRSTFETSSNCNIIVNNAMKVRTVLRPTSKTKEWKSGNRTSDIFRFQKDYWSEGKKLTINILTDFRQILVCIGTVCFCNCKHRTTQDNMHVFKAKAHARNMNWPQFQCNKVRV